jgi:hypothetical protein
MSRDHSDHSVSMAVMGWTAWARRTVNLIPYLHAALDAVAKVPEPAPGS